MADGQDSAHEGSLPDIMNDPEYATNTGDGEDGMGDADTCRICRGEGSDAEPLFHPCKCSGSIKYVHQDCLMEWLSHSQKKHCELCKTAFRFTKLYHPNMPQSLPFLVLCRHVIIHTIKNLATWLRFCLVVTVWLGFLPYIIRQVWRLLFWFSDGGWPPNYLAIDTTRNATSLQALELARGLQELAAIAGNGTSPVSPLQANQTSPASMGRYVGKLMGFLMPISQTLNLSAADPLAAGLTKALYYGLGIQTATGPAGVTVNETSHQYLKNLAPPARSSLLSEISILRNLTRNAYINQLIITIAEGYVITILVVVCFILVFLIREWVVQQQPGINMGAGFNAEFAAPERLREELDQAVVAQGNANQVNANQRRDIRQRPIAQARRRNVPQNNADDVRLQQHHIDMPQPQPHEFGPGPDIGGTQQRPVPVRDALTPAAEIQRALTEEPRINEEPRMVEEFLAMWKRAGSDPNEVLRIIEREGKSDEMRYWVNAMKILQSPATQNSTALPSSSSSSSSTAPAVTSGISDLESATSSVRGVAGSSSGRKSSASSDSWEDVPTETKSEFESLPTNDFHQEHTETNATFKGKSKAVSKEVTPIHQHGQDEQSETTLLKAIPQETGPQDNGKQHDAYKEFPSMEGAHSDRHWSSLGNSRPRAVSDGPTIKDSISPLAHNNWSFSNIPADDRDDSSKSIGVWRPADPKYFSSSPFSEYAPSSSSDLVEAIDPRVKLQSHHAWKAEQDFRSQQAVRNGQEAGPSGLDNQASPEDAAMFLVGDGSGGNGPIRITGQDGIVRSYDSWDDVPANLSSDSEDGIEDDDDGENLNHNRLLPDIPIPEAPEPTARPAEPQGFLGNVAEFLWGGIGDEGGQEDQGADDEHIVQNLAAEAPFVPVAHNDRFDQAGDLADRDREVVEAAIAAGLDPNDPDAIDDAEDFEGIMELVGMRGPIFSLVQNALFSAFLLALTVAVGVWVPYNIGRVSLLLVANPGPAFKLPLRLIFGFAALIQDLALSLMGLISYLVISLLSIPLNLWSQSSSASNSTISYKGGELGSAALNLSHGAVDRMLDGVVYNLAHITDSEIFAFSAASHESLIGLQSLIINIFTTIGNTITFIFVGSYSISFWGIWYFLVEPLRYLWHFIIMLPSLLMKPDSWVISLELEKRSAPLNLELSVWDGVDRFWAVTAGYTAIFLLGALYVRKGSPFSSGQVGREWEAAIIDLLNQAGGVMKVILIISIEMLVFPLYCGLLLDAALLPLFENTTIMSRIAFTCKSPLTSIFVHWFVGTCYMFHFALFVSMCRKIMRKGVLYFIRDPDDPTFHPVRDVLERNVATQLRKILFSALVYGGLVVICLGGVVWGLAYAFRGVLPIHWSSNEPVLEFPIDLLFYNFLMPLAVRFFKPSDGLHAMYSWWFRQCARMLRLTWFMFGERKQDEEGHHVRRTWWDVLKGVRGDPLQRFDPSYASYPFDEDETGTLKAYFRADGRYVRAPASDQVRIPKGTKIFVEVDEINTRIDGKWDRPDGLQGRESELYKQVYVPPWFRVRIFIFIVSIWLFAALTGVSITIVPLVFGRMVFAKLIPAHVRKNDVYAFSIGIYILGSALYAVLHTGKFISYVRSALVINANTPQKVLRHAVFWVSRIARVVWTYSAFIFLLPTLFAFLVEFYFIVPLHTYFMNGEPHVIHFVQSWTLGLLYLKITSRLILWHEDSRPAQSLKAITRDGYLNPDAKLATRSFIIPGSLVLGTALVYPFCLAKIVVLTVLRENPEKHTLAYRYAYPMTLCLVCIAFALYVLLGWVKEWRMKIRDEVYLIGERLHNFGDRKTASSGVSVPSVRRIET